MGFVLTACGGGGGGAEETPTPKETAATAPATEEGTPAATEEGTPAEDVERELEELAQRWEGREAKVVYQLTSKSAGEVDEGSLILYWKPPDWRVDFQSATELASVVQRGGDFFICQETDRTCIKLPLEGPIPMPLPFLFIRPSDIPNLVRERVIERITGIQIERSTRRIAGEEARCFSVTGGERVGQGTFEMCWSEDGILLFLSTDFTDQQGNTFTTTMEATGVERTVSEQDVRPPYQVQELPFDVPGE
jgi:hypothetical protein